MSVISNFATLVVTWHYSSLLGGQLLLRLRSVKTIKEMVCPDRCKPLSEAGLVPPREFRDVGRLDLKPKAFE
jgi:hypothetical protein